MGTFGDAPPEKRRPPASAILRLPALPVDALKPL
jgi:hypothetical protein